MPGMKNGALIVFERDDILESTVAVKTVTAVIDSGCRNDGVGGSDTDLKKGLMLAKITASGKMSNFDADAVSGLEDESTAAILWQDVDVSGGDVTATVLVAGAIDLDEINLNGETFTWANCQRLEPR